MISYALQTETIEAVKRVMKNTIVVLDEVVQFLSDWKDPNDPDDVMHFKEVDLIISKMPSYKLTGLKANYTWGELMINKSSDVFGSHEYDCIENKVSKAVQVTLGLGQNKTF